MSNLNLEQILENALNIDKETNQNAMKEIINLSQSNLSLFLQNLGNILSDENKPSNIRQLSAILMKNSLIHYENFQKEWKEKISNEEKNKIKLLVLSTLASQYKEIRTSASNVISSICKIDQPIMTHWPNLINSLTKNCFIDDINLKLSAIETLGYVCEEINIKFIDSNTVDIIMNSLIQNLIDNNNNINVIIQVLKSLFFTVKLAEKNFSNEKEMNIIMNAIFSCGEKYKNNDDILEKIAMLFIEMFNISSYYDYINPYFDKIIQFAFNIINGKYESNERLSLLGIEIICSIGDEESKRESNKIIIKNTINGLKIENINNNSRKYFNRVNKELIDLILKFVKVPEEDEDENEWNLSKGCLHILSVLVKVIDRDNIYNFYLKLYNQICQCNNINDKCKCWYLVSGCLSSFNNNEIKTLISNNLNRIYKDIDSNENIKLQKSATFLLTKISKTLPKLIDSNKFNEIIPLLLNTFIKPNPIVCQNICIILQNIIKFNGDLNTNKSSNILSNYFDDIVRRLFIPAINEVLSNSEDLKLALSRLITIGTLIEYSSHDKQDKIMEILMQFLKEIESTINQFDNIISKGSNIERIYQLQDYYYTILNIIFNKYKSEINLELGKKIWELTENVFKLRKTVFEEANIALSSLSTNMKTNFKEIFNNYYPYITYSIKSYNIKDLCKSGLVSLLNSIRSIGNNIEGKSKEIILILIEVCTSNEVSRENKTISISCIGEIAINIGIKFEEYLNIVFQLLFSACETTINNNNIDNDEDTIEFIINLRYELIMTFNCIVFSVEEKTNLLNPYINNMFKFFKAIVNDDIFMAPKILKNMISLVVDLVNIYGNEIIEVCDENFASNLIVNLKKFHISNYENELIQYENFFKKLYLK